MQICVQIGLEQREKLIIHGAGLCMDICGIQQTVNTKLQVQILLREIHLARIMQILIQSVSVYAANFCLLIKFTARDAKPLWKNGFRSENFSLKFEFCEFSVAKFTLLISVFFFLVQTSKVDFVGVEFDSLSALRS